jgi:hypothetical protein
VSRSLTRIGDLVGRVLPANRGAERLVRLIAAWPEMVGDAVAREAWPARITSNETLLVHVTSAVWASELTYLASSLQSRLVATLGAEAPQAVLFRVGPVPQTAAPVAAHVSREPSPSEFQRAARAVRAIGDADIRRAAHNALARALAREAQEP